MRILNRMLHFVESWVPDPFILALVLTFLSLVMAGIWADASLLTLTDSWFKGFWELLEFAMQMCMVLVTGYVIADTRWIQNMLDAIGGRTISPQSAVFLCAFLSMLAGLVHWGLGLMAGAILARRMGIFLHRRGVMVHYPLLGAAGYMGLSVWHGGLSGSAPLIVAQSRHFLADVMGTIPLRNTIGWWPNLGVNAVALIIIPLILAIMHPPSEQSRGPEGFPGLNLQKATETQPEARQTKGLENFTGSGVLVGTLGLLVILFLFQQNRIQGVNLNVMTGFFLFGGMILHGKLSNFLGSFYQAAGACGPIILQFPFYGGILGIMKYAGLAEVLSTFLVQNSTAQSFLLWVYLSAGFINMFVPSGGGQWAVQGPIIIQAARHFDLPLSHAVMALAYGDEWTNLIQPFWALPLLSITGLRARDIMGYCSVILFVHAVLFGTMLLLSSI